MHEDLLTQIRGINLVVVKFFGPSVAAFAAVASVAAFAAVKSVAAFAAVESVESVVDLIGDYVNLVTRRRGNF